MYKKSKINKNQNKINKKQNKGITLIALVITIIVLLILAGVTINTLFDNGNAIDKAAEARDETNKGNIKEQLQLAVIASRINDNNANINIDKLKSELEKLKNTGTIGEYEPSEENLELPCTVTKGNYEFTIDEDGNVKDGQTTPGGGTLTKSQKINKVIGQTVAYGEDIDGYNGGWRVFYASEDEMFLIAADVVEKQRLSDYISKYDGGTKDVFSEKTAGAESVYTYKNVTYGEKYNSKWKEILNGRTYIKDQIKATAYLCDPVNWEKYISKSAPNETYAVGGATLELLALSWEATGHEANWSDPVNGQIKEEGYRYNEPKGLYDENPLLRTILPKTPGGEDGLYNTGTIYCLASPSCSYSKSVFIVVNRSYRYQFAYY